MEKLRRPNRTRKQIRDLQKKFKPRAKNHHHLVADSRGGPKVTPNLLWMYVVRHNSLHDIISLMTPDEFMPMFKKFVDAWEEAFYDLTPNQAYQLMFRTLTMKAKQKL